MIICNKKSIPLNKKVYIHATDTCYGFATRFDDTYGLEIIQKLKHRVPNKPYSLLFSSLDQLKEYCFIHYDQEKFILSQSIPSSFILKKKEILNYYFKNEPNVSARIENDNFPVKIAFLLGTPVTSTSVNISKNPPLYKIKDIINTFGDVSDDIVFINSGDIKEIPPSTIWDLTKDPYVKFR